MSVTIVSLEELDRLFYERIRREVVAAGLLPDVTLYSTDATYQAARTTLLNSLDSTTQRLVDVFGEGSYDDKGEIRTARITIRRMTEEPGTIGGFPATFFTEQQDGKFTKSYYPSTSSDVTYQIRVVSDITANSRVLSQILYKALKHRMFYQTVGNTGSYTNKRVLVMAIGSADLSQQHYIEKLYRYRVEDIFLEDPEVIATNIPVLSTVEFSVYSLPGNADDNELTKVTLI